MGELTAGEESLSCDIDLYSGGLSFGVAVARSQESTSDELIYLSLIGVQVACRSSGMDRGMGLIILAPVSGALKFSVDESAHQRDSNGNSEREQAV